MKTSWVGRLSLQSEASEHQTGVQGVLLASRPFGGPDGFHVSDIRIADEIGPMPWHEVGQGHRVTAASEGHL